MDFSYNYFQILFLFCCTLASIVKGLECFNCYYHSEYPEGLRNNTKLCLNPGPKFLEPLPSEPYAGSGGPQFHAYCLMEESVQKGGYQFVERGHSWFAFDDQDGNCLTDLPGREGKICYCKQDGCNGRIVKEQPTVKKDKKEKKKRPNNEL